HKFPVVFAERAGPSAIAGVGEISAARPFPNVAEHLLELVSIISNRGRRMKALPVDEVTVDRNSAAGVFPFELCRQTRAVPVRISIRFEITDVRDRFGFFHAPKSG